MGAPFFLKYFDNTSVSENIEVSNTLRRLDQMNTIAYKLKYCTKLKYLFGRHSFFLQVKEDFITH